MSSWSEIELDVIDSVSSEFAVYRALDIAFFKKPGEVSD